jgi:cytochrome c biogenesis protein CcdA/thiol-disulfide isomerase/thioredoxin
MLTLALIGLVGGLITGISPCVLPVLPVVFFSGGVQGAGGEGRARWRPYLVIAGLVVSFSLLTLTGSALLALLRLPQDLLRWLGLVALVAIGVGLIVPRVQEWIEKPFARIAQRPVGADRGGFVLGLALGAVYVPCAGPVLAAITVAGATGRIGVETLVLTAAFAIGTAIPLLAFALAGRGLAARLGAFRRHERGLRITAGVVMIGLAVSLVFDLPAILQRAIPDYTSALQEAAGGSDVVKDNLNAMPLRLGCTERAAVLVDCGAAPELVGITGWLNSPALDLASLRGSVVLIDFWAYSCINCQRATPHLNAWWDAYRDHGLTIIGVHSPEYAFEKVPSNVAAGAARVGIEYPIALDTDFATWTAYNNYYWPAEYLIDAKGDIRHLVYGEGDYEETEALIRQLLKDADPAVSLPPATEVPDLTPDNPYQTPESYLNSQRVSNYAGEGLYADGTREFRFPATLGEDQFALEGTWTIDDQGATAGAGLTADGSAAIRLDFLAQHVYLDVGGTGTLTVVRNGVRTTIPVSGEPNIYDLVDLARSQHGTLDVELTPGLQAYSFTFG